MLMLLLLVVVMFVVVVVIVDCVIGELVGWYLFVVFGCFVVCIEVVLNMGWCGCVIGVVVWFVVVVLLVVVVVWFVVVLFWLFVVVLYVVLLWFVFGVKSFVEYVVLIVVVLLWCDFDVVCVLIVCIVLCDISNVDEGVLLCVVVELVFENGNDVIFGVFFWFVVVGGFGVLLFWFVNMFDVMWGYCMLCFLIFGWVVVCFDDVLNWMFVWFIVVSYVLFGDMVVVWCCWCMQVCYWDSLNVGFVMVVGVGSLNVQFGGLVVYYGEIEDCLVFGIGVMVIVFYIVVVLLFVMCMFVLWFVLLVVSGVFVMVIYYV